LSGKFFEILQKDSVQPPFFRLSVCIKNSRNSPLLRHGAPRPLAGAWPPTPFVGFLLLQRFWCCLRVAVTQTVLFPPSAQPAAILDFWVSGRNKIAAHLAFTCVKIDVNMRVRTRHRVLRICFTAFLKTWPLGAGQTKMAHRCDRLERRRPFGRGREAAGVWRPDERALARRGLTSWRAIVTRAVTIQQPAAASSGGFLRRDRPVLLLPRAAPAVNAAQPPWTASQVTTEQSRCIYFVMRKRVGQRS
jgi:hypothetical protein